MVPPSPSLTPQVLLPNMSKVEGTTEEEKLLVVATTKCLCEFPPLQQARDLWNAVKEEAIRKVEGESRPPRPAPCYLLGLES